jgi:octaprenyl-diphosphate synthase
MAGVTASATEAVGLEMRAVEELFDAELRSELPCVDQLVTHVRRFRGKMLRPKMVFLCGRAAGGITPQHVTIAAVVEMVHMATLVHDDVLDESELRRRGATINHLKGNEAAVMLGDYLISHSYHLCSSLGSQDAARMIARTTNQVCEGELLQLHNRNNLDLDEETYVTIIGRKTASLIAASCYLGATLAGATDVVAREFEKFGQSLGIAFQIQDDLLDLVGDQENVGKTLGLDVAKRKLTLPVIHFLRTAPQEHRELCRSLLRGSEPNQLERVRNLILPSGAIDYSRDRVRRLIERGKQCLTGLPHNGAIDELLTLADTLLQRDR